MYDDFIRYLAAKKSVDDRALNPHVAATMQAALATAPRPLRVLEVGAGAGAMVERLAVQTLPAAVEYTAIDAAPALIAHARVRLATWARAAGWQVEETDRGLRLAQPSRWLHLRLETADVFEFAARQQGQARWDLLIAHAFLDLVDAQALLPRLFALLAPGGLFYFTINFDGVTAFHPPIDPALDVQIEALYHRSMDERIRDGRPSGDSRTGRHLFGHLRALGAGLLAAGPSDWVVFARQGRYDGDEAYFLHFIIHTMQSALAAHPGGTCHALLQTGRLHAWAEQRHAQIERGELVYIAHQLDFFGQAPA